MAKVYWKGIGWVREEAQKDKWGGFDPRFSNNSSYSKKGGQKHDEVLECAIAQNDNNNWN